MRIKELRERHELKQVYVARKAKISQPLLCVMESGKAIPNEATAHKLSELFNCQMDELFDTEIPYLKQVVKSERESVKKDRHKLSHRLYARVNKDTYIKLHDALDGETVQHFFEDCIKRKIKWAEKKTARLREQSLRPNQNISSSEYQESEDLSNG